MTSEGFKEYQRKYKKLKYKQITIMLRLGRDDDIIENLLGANNKAERIRNLIRKGMSK